MGESKGDFVEQGKMKLEMDSKPDELTLKLGSKLGRLTVIQLGMMTGGRKAALLSCECGNDKLIRISTLKSGKANSCGCLQKELARENHTTHGGRSKPEYTVWCSMKRRCNDLGCDKYQYYGGRGIKVCPEWNSSFEQFLNDMGERPSSDHSIERRDGNGDYCPQNCRWATKEEQMNNKSDNRVITAFEETMTVAQWSRKTGASYWNIIWRLNNGWLPEIAVMP